MKIFKTKSLGQHFLTRPEVSKKIVEAAQISSEDNIVEIGPGAGILTQNIVEAKPKKLVLVELDARLIDLLSKKFPGIDIVNKDAGSLSYDMLFSEYFTGGDVLVLGNLPYNASTAILEALCVAACKPRKMVLMFQKEVAQRILAVPGKKVYGRLSLLASEFYEIRQVMQLAPGAFTPPPKVDSTVLHFSLMASPVAEIMDRRIYEKVVRSAFSNKRKMIKNNLKELLPGVLLDDILLKCDILPNQRPEELSLKKYAALANLLFKMKEEGTKK